MEKISGKIVVKSGLHIGGSDDTMKIGGVDSPVIKREIKWNRDKKRVDYINGEFISEPYIPGSSLKGKIRSLLEHYFGLHKKLAKVYQERCEKFSRYLIPKGILSVDDFEKLKKEEKIEKKLLKKIEDREEYKKYEEIKKVVGEVISSKHLEYFNENEKKYANLIIKLFGESAGNKNKEITIASLVFRDSFLTDEIREKALSGELELTEEKFENVIDRFSGTTRLGGLRQIERVVPGVEFEFEAIIRDINNLDVELAKNTLFLGLKLLENDYLGGNGSRGYGEVEFMELDDEFKDETIESLKNKIEEKLKEAKDESL